MTFLNVFFTSTIIKNPLSPLLEHFSYNSKKKPFPCPKQNENETGRKMQRKSNVGLRALRDGSNKFQQF